MKICMVVSSPLTVKAFLIDQLTALSEIHNVHLLLNSADPASIRIPGERVKISRIPIVREISPLKDCLALARLYRAFRSGRYDAVHSVTPKAGLLAMTAASFAGVPVRVHTFTGQVWVTRAGLTRKILRLADKAIARFATDVLVDSLSQRQFLIDENIVSDEKAQVLAKGSISGVDTARFCANQAARSAIRSREGIPDDAIVFLYVGRLNADKGIYDLAGAFARVATTQGNMRLFLVGPDEDETFPNICSRYAGIKQFVHRVDYTENPEQYMAAADVFCLPSYREGFGTVIIEAASAGLPCVASRIYGVTDAVVEGVTGLFHQPGNVPEIASAMTRMMDPETRRTMGHNARLRVRAEFPKERLTAAMVEFYRDLERELQDRRKRRRNAWLKRCLDLMVASSALVVLAPVLIAVAVVVRILIGGPIFFRQVRPALNGCLFQLLKFRTMTDERDAEGRPLPDGERLTPLGRLLRDASLDELPELFNVLRGEMSLVGPRPLLPQYLSRYNEFQRRRHEVKPGITGWAQVNGRNALTWEHKFELDVWYVDHRSLWLDLKILWLTVLKVLKREGIAQEGHATMPEFMGSQAKDTP